MIFSLCGPSAGESGHFVQPPLHNPSSGESEEAGRQGMPVKREAMSYEKLVRGGNGVCVGVQCCSTDQMAK
eukprot:6062809-Amphidinium_carterae.1